MDSLIETLISSFVQMGAVLLICLLIYGFSRLFKKSKSSFRNFIGLRLSYEQFDKTFLVILLAIILVSVVNVILQFYFSPTFKGFLLSDTSPYGKILKDGFGIVQTLSGLLYCFVQSGGAEEILFRGLFARMFIQKFGFAVGNSIQAILFWIMHLLIFKLVTGEWFSLIQVHAFVVSFGLGLAFGFVNYRKGDLSIAPSWVIHGTINFVTFLTIAALIG